MFSKFQKSLYTSLFHHEMLTGKLRWSVESFGLCLASACRSMHDASEVATRHRTFLAGTNHGPAILILYL